MMRISAFVFGSALAATTALAQSPGQPRLASSGERPAPNTTGAAVRAVRPPVIDGRDDDEVWRQAPPIEGFRQFEPVEDGDTRFRTVAKVAYDDRYFYAIVRAYDPAPDSIVALLSRRDVKTPSEWLKIIISPYNDGRTGVEMSVNPLGVKRDYAIYADITEDEGWDGIWDVATSVDSLGWVAEYRVPFSQLRFNRANHTFGFGVWRDIARTNTRDSWPVYRYSKPGLISQLGTITGFVNIPSPKRLEVLPYAVTKNVTKPGAGVEFKHEQEVSGGADLKYGVSSNLTLDATINPDFGQVESDPAVLNLSAFETFLTERRPFFVEGAGIFSFDVSCSNGICTGLFYPRRIGREPQLSDGDPNTPATTTILSAAKLTGRLSSGLSLGVMDAVTQREQGAAEQTVEPQTNYFVTRLQQDLRRGESGVGLMLTGVNRSLDAVTRDVLRREAYTGGIDFRHRFLGQRYQVNGYVTGSRVAGSASAMTETQLEHWYQRPDDRLALDPARTTLAGDAENIHFGKVGGGVTRFGLDYGRFSPGFEINDAGFLRRVNIQSTDLWTALQLQRPRYFYRRLMVNFEHWHTWTVAKDALTGGPLPLENGTNLNVNTQLKNSWWLFTGGQVNNLGPTYCDVDCTRGGPAVRTSRGVAGWFGFNGDMRRRIIPNFNVNVGRADEGRSPNWSVSPSVDVRASSSLSLSLGPNYFHGITDAQFVSSFTVGAPKAYTFARLSQNVLSLTTRVDYTATPTLSFQVYAQPFVAAGRYARLRTLSDRPRARDYDARYAAVTTRAPTAADTALLTANNVPLRGITRIVDLPGNAQSVIALRDPDFNLKQFRSNFVMRWEYRPGSTLFLVWGQDRDQFGIDNGVFRARHDLDNLFATRPRNVFLIKASYWMNF